jgi:hypothetical protein
VIPAEPLRSRVRWLFLATVALALAPCNDKDAFPGLHAPGFRDPGRLEDLARRPPARDVLVRVRFRGGADQVFPLLDLLPRVHYKQRRVVEGALVRALTSGRGASARDWLRGAVRARQPGVAPERIEVRAIPRSDPGREELLYADEPGGAA